MPSVSILLPFRNAASTLDAAIAGMAHQSFTDWDLLLIDNASNDESGSIAFDWSQRDPRIRVIHEPTIGIAHALNLSLIHISEPTRPY